MKSFDTLIHAMSLIKDIAVDLTIIGEGILAAKLKALCLEVGIDNRVIFKGHVEDIRGELAKADLFCIASSSKESFGQALIEAMAMGLPVVCSDFGPFPEINIHGTTGYIVPCGDAAGFADRLRYLLSHPTERTMMSANARSLVEQVFDENLMVSNMLSIYEHETRT